MARQAISYYREGSRNRSQDRTSSPSCTGTTVAQAVADRRCTERVCRLSVSGSGKLNSRRAGLPVSQFPAPGCLQTVPGTLATPARPALGGDLSHGRECMLRRKQKVRAPRARIGSHRPEPWRNLTLATHHPRNSEAPVRPVRMR